MEGELLYKKKFDIETLIKYAYFCRPKFYKEFIEQFDSKETIENLKLRPYEAIMYRIK